MQPALHAPRPTSVSGGQTPPTAPAHRRPSSFRSVRGLTLMEVVFAMVIQATVMLACIGTFIQSRRITEANVLHAAATSMVYGIIEQIKQLDYTTQLPSYETDPFAPVSPAPNPKTPPYFRVRLNQSEVVWLMVVHTPSTATPAGPTTTPALNVNSAAIGAIDNATGNIPLSTVTGTASQRININFWVWIDDIPSGDASEVKKVTVVYTYDYMDGNIQRRVRDREVIIRTRFDQ